MRKTLRHQWTTPRSAIRGLGEKSIPPDANARIHDVDKVTPPIVGYGVCQVRMAVLCICSCRAYLWIGICQPDAQRLGQSPQDQGALRPDYSRFRRQPCLGTEDARLPDQVSFYCYPTHGLTLRRFVSEVFDGIVAPSPDDDDVHDDPSPAMNHRAQIAELARREREEAAAAAVTAAEHN